MKVGDGLWALAKKNNWLAASGAATWGIANVVCLGMAFVSEKTVLLNRHFCGEL